MSFCFSFQRDNNLIAKLGLKEGMKMLVSTSIIPVNAQQSEIPPLATATVVNPTVLQDSGFIPKYVVICVFPLVEIPCQLINSF